MQKGHCTGMKHLILALGAAFCAAAYAGGDLEWPETVPEMKPWVYNWWMGSAVDEKGIEHQCRELADKGFGGFHVIPIYGAKGYEKNYRPLLSPEWIGAWNMAVKTARRFGLGVDLTMGAGWCFGGPWVSEEDAASSKMKVKRAGPGGEGYMIDPFSPRAMSNHVERFEAAFGRNGTAERPRAFYHDSYEYYGAVPKNGGDIDELQLATFRVWTDWCRRNGYITRNEAHGAPSNWLDFYALADIPETEMFGKGDRDILISKFASSAAHVKGTRLVSAESCTWIDEHFCERPREIKEFIDRLFLAGVNHVFYHGLNYSPVDAPWPGWCFYASLEMNPRNPIWREVKALNDYITRCQSIFQTWESDNDLAIVWDPDSFRKKKPNEVRQMSVHGREWFYGEPIGKVAKKLYAEGYCFDYISPRMLAQGLGAKYAEVIDPAVSSAPVKARRSPFDSASGLMATRWKKDGRILYFVVNQGAGAVCVSAEGRFWTMNPLDGEIGNFESVLIEPNHSLFIAEAAGLRTSLSGGGKRTKALALKCGGWTVTPVCGGPKTPEVKRLSAPAGWETWDDAFSGTMRYATTFDADDETWKAMFEGRQAVRIDLGDVRETARVKINGADLGVKFMPPYSFVCPLRHIKTCGNVLEVEVTNLGANRLRWNDMNGVKWKIFYDINMVGMNYRPLDAAGYRVHPSGLLGPVTLECRTCSGH